MRIVLAALAVVVVAVSPQEASAADAGKRRAAADRGYDRETVVEVRRRDRYLDGWATYQKPRARGVVMEQVAGERRRVFDADGMPMTRSYVLSEPPRRIEKRVYVRDDERKPLALLYGGFYGSHRWGVSREGW